MRVRDRDVDAGGPLYRTTGVVPLLREAGAFLPVRRISCVHLSRQLPRVLEASSSASECAVALSLGVSPKALPLPNAAPVAAVLI